MNRNNEVRAGSAERKEVAEGPFYYRCGIDMALPLILQHLLDGRKILILLPANGGLADEEFPDVGLAKILKVDVLADDDQELIFEALQDDYDEIISITDSEVNTESPEYWSAEDAIYSALAREAMIHRGRIVTLD